MMLDIDIDSDPAWDSRSGWTGLVRSAAEAAIAESAFPRLTTGERQMELSVRLTGDSEVKALNARWRGKDEPTNVLSFPQMEPEELTKIAEDGTGLMLGDLVLAHGVCEREAADKHLPLQSHAAHLIVHGTLHLLGYDHHDDRSAETMESLEVRALARIGLGDPYEGER